ncbi:MAG: DUF4198 domain-containing protein [Micropepsaceae bacterium]
MRRIALISAAACLLAGLASAHSPFLLPNVFAAGDRDHVTVQGSFTEAFFAPDVAMKSDDYHVVGPDGAKTPVTPVYFKDVAILEVPLAAEGTYRISTGARVGRTAKAYEKDGNWEFLEPGEAPPEGATAVDMVSLTSADVYVSKGKASEVPARGQGIELAPAKVGETAAGEPVTFRLLFEGQPLEGEAVALHRAGETYSGAAPVEVKTGADGAVTFTPAEAGVYLVMTRHRVGPEAEGGPHRSYTASVTFEVVP